MSISTTKMTARQFMQLGEDPEGVRLELINGEIAVSPSPSPKHQYTVVKLGGIMAEHAEANDLGEVLADLSTRLDKHNVPRPDILFFSKDRRNLMGEGFPKIPPDLAVEVISPGSRKLDRGRKFKLYCKRGIAFYWIVDPIQRTIEAYRLNSDKYEEAGSESGDAVVTLPPFLTLKLPLAKLWRPAVPD